MSHNAFVTTVRSCGFFWDHTVLVLAPKPCVVVASEKQNTPGVK